MRNLKYLIADDSATVRKLVSKAIENRLGASAIFEAKDGVEAINLLKLNKVDIILSDWDMPNMKGDEFLLEVRSNKEWKDIPFIMMTANASKDFIVTAVQLGVSEYITKPFTPEELEEKLRKAWNVISKRQGQRYASLPHHKLAMKLEGSTIYGEVVNISRTGMLSKFEYDDRIKLFGFYELGLAVQKKDTKENWLIAPLVGKVVRLESDGTHLHSTKPTCLIAFYFEPSKMAKSVESVLIGFLKWLNSQGPETIPAE